MWEQSNGILGGVGTNKNLFYSHKVLHRYHCTNDTLDSLCPSYLRLHITLMTECVIYIPGWWLLVQRDVHTKRGASQHSYCLSFSGLHMCTHRSTQTNWYMSPHSDWQPLCFLSLADVEAVEAWCATLREAGGGLSSGRGTQPPANGSSDRPQHFMAPWSPTAEPRPAHLPHDSCRAGCVWLLRVDCTHPHLPPGNCFQTAKSDREGVKSSDL